MPADLKLLQRIRDVLKDRPNVTEKKMFGSVAFMISGNMACGPHHDTLLARVGEAAAVTALKEPHVKPMDFTGKPLKPFITILPQGLKTDAQLRRWVTLAADYAASLPPAKPKAPRKPRPASRSSTAPVANPAIEAFLATYPAAIDALAITLLQTLTAADPSLTLKFLPGWRAVAVRHPKSGHLCALFPEQTQLKLYFEYGALLPDPDFLLQGDTKQTRHILFNSLRDIKKRPLVQLIRDAIRLRTP